MVCARRNAAGPLEKRCYDNRLSQPHGDVTPVILPNAPRFSVCCTCVEYPTRNIAARAALTQRPSAGTAAIGGLNPWRALANRPSNYPADSQRRVLLISLPQRNPQIPDAGTAAGIHVRQTLAR